MKVVQIFKNGDMCDLECKFTKKNIIKILTQQSKSSGNNSLKLLYKWILGNSEMLCYGWYDGEAGFENKHDLPPSGTSTFIDSDSSEQLLFGDIFIVKVCKGKYNPFTIEEYSDYYNQLFGGFDDCESSDEVYSGEEEDEDYSGEEEDEDYSDEEEYYSDNEKELNEDKTNY